MATVIDQDLNISSSNAPVTFDSVFQMAMSISSDWYDLIKYDGFNITTIRIQAMKNFTADEILKIAVIGALRGGGSKTRQRDDNKLNRVEISSSKGTLSNLFATNKLKEEKLHSGNDLKSTDLTILRITAAFAPQVAAFLRRREIPKKIEDSPLPGWLQFPHAACIKMTPTGVALMRDFCERYSVKIGGKFQASIFDSQVANAYPLGSVGIERDLAKQFSHFDHPERLVLDAEKAADDAREARERREAEMEEKGNDTNTTIDLTQRDVARGIKTTDGQKKKSGNT